MQINDDIHNDNIHSDNLHVIQGIEPGSIAQEMDLEPGDILLSINGQKIADVLDYRFMTQAEAILLEIEKPNGEIWELDIEKEESDDLGLVFESGLMDQTRDCHNNCIFCFMDQLPKHMRPSLYFKDDDPRLSFLSGNYVTLTNLSPAEAKRIARYHLSPLHISVHASDPELRGQMLNNQETKSGSLFDHLRCFSDAGITMHFQIVLCKGINDGLVLDDTIGALLALGPKAASLSVVPVGLTQYRDGLYPLEAFSPEDAKGVIRQVEKWQAQAHKLHGTSFVYCADEWYIKSDIPLPAYNHYEDFPQLENGVGMWALFEQEFMQGLKSTLELILKRVQKSPPKHHTNEKLIGIVTGEAAQDLIEKLVGQMLESVYGSVRGTMLGLAHQSVKIYPVQNHFFGRAVTVSGLLTGTDIISQVGEKARQDGCTGLFLPQNMFRAETECTLDDMTREDIEQALGLPVYIGDTNGEKFAKELLDILK